jgi:hypothetical protein
MAEVENVGHERRDLSPHVVIGMAFGLVTTLILVLIAVHLFQSELRHEERGEETRAPRIAVPPPRLQVNPAADLAELRESEEATLHSYGWIKRDAGVIHIPIERAIELTAERGLPARDARKGAAP